jgi:hypothetical protein
MILQFGFFRIADALERGIRIVISPHKGGGKERMMVEVGT